MEIIFQVVDLQRALAQVCPIIPSRHAAPIVQHMVINAENGRVRLLGTNMDVRVEVATFGAAILAEGSIAVSSEQFQKLVRSLPKGAEVHIEAKGDVLTGKCARRSFQVGTLPAADFPAMTSGEWSAEFSVGQADLANLIIDTAYAVGTDSQTQPAETAVALSAESGKMTAAATNGKRAVVNTLADDGIPDFAPVLVHAGMLTYMSRLLTSGGAVETVSLRTSDHHIEVTAGPVVTKARLVDAQPLPIGRIIKIGREAKRVTAELDCVELQAAVDAAAAVARREATNSLIGLLVEDEFATVFTSSTYNDSAFLERVSCKYRGAPFTVGVNVKYMLDHLRRVPGEMVTLSFDRDAPCDKPFFVETGVEGRTLLQGPVRWVEAPAKRLAA